MRKVSRRKKATVISIVLVLVLLGLFLYWTQSESSGTIKQATPKQQNQKQTGYKQLDGKLVKLSYLSTYFAQQMEAKDNDLELYQLTADTAYTKQLAVNVSTLPDGTLSSSSAYRLRQDRPDLYIKRSIQVDGQSVDIWVAQDGTEQTAIIPKGNTVAVLAFTQKSGNLSGLTTEVDAVVKSFSWK